MIIIRTVKIACSTTVAHTPVGQTYDSLLLKKSYTPTIFPRYQKESKDETIPIRALYVASSGTIHETP